MNSFSGSYSAFIIKDNKLGGMINRYYELIENCLLDNTIPIILDYKEDKSRQSISSKLNNRKRFICVNFNKFNHTFFHILRIAFLQYKYKFKAIIAMGRTTYIIILIARFLCFNKFKILYLIRNSQKEHPIFKERLFSSLIKKLSKRSDGLVAISSGLLTEEQVIRSRACFKTFIHNGIDIKNIKLNKKFLKKNNKLKLLWVGRIDHQKNHEMLLRVLEILFSKNLKFEVDVYSSICPDKIKSIHANYYPWAKDIPYENYDLFLNTSNYEGFGRTLIESLSNGTPVISTDCNFGPSEILTLACGVLVNINSAREMSNAIIEWNDLSFNEKLRMRQSAIVRSKSFDIEKMISQYKKVFNLFLT